MVQGPSWKIGPVSTKILRTEFDKTYITASFDNGVLTITVPRAQKAQPKRIPVTAQAEQTVIDGPRG